MRQGSSLGWATRGSAVASAPPRRRARLATIAAGALLLPILGPFGEATAAPETIAKPAPPLEREATWLPEEFTPAEALDDAHVMIDEKIAALRERFDRRLGIISVDRESSTVRIPVVGLTAAEAAEISGLTERGVSFVGSAALVGELDLIELSELIAAELDQHGAVARAGVELDAAQVYVASDGELSGSHRQLVDAVVERWDQERRAGEGGGEPAESGDFVKFEQGSWQLTEARRSAPFRTGRWVVSSDRGAGCTGGFLMRRRSDNSLRATTAGHCFNGFATLRMDDGSTVGSVTNLNPDGWDFAAARVPSGYDGRPKVTIDSSGAYRLVSEKVSRPVHGHIYCWAGRGLWANERRNEGCGRRGRTLVYNRRTYDCVERRGWPGDSGAGVYGIRDGRAVATGFMALGLRVENPVRHYACHNSLGSIEGSSAGLEVVTQK